MYGVIALFDNKTEQIIKDIWNELRENSISFYAEEVKDRRPHITIGSYNNLNKSHFIKQLDHYYKDKTTIDISFNTIGSFFNSGTLFFSPTPTKELIAFHFEHHEYFTKYVDDPESLYSPGNWVPHCTIANRVRQDKLAEAFTYCSNRNDQIHGKIMEVALVELVFKDEKCVEAPIIFSRKLLTNG